MGWRRTLLGLLVVGVLVVGLLQIASGNQRDTEQAESLLATGHTYLSEGNSELAYEAFASALELFRLLENRWGEGEALRCEGIALVGLGDASAAVDQFHQALEISKEIDDLAMEAGCYMELGYAHIQLGDLRLAVECFETARESFVALSDRSGKIGAIRGLIAASDISAAVEHFQQLLEVLKEIGDRALEAWCYIDLGQAYMQLGDLPLAVEYFETARESFVALSDRAGEIEALRSEGHCLLALAEEFRSTNPVEAISVVKQSLRAFQDAEDEQGEGNALMTLAGLYAFVSRFAEALDYAKQAESVLRSTGDLMGTAHAMEIRASCHLDLSQYDLALEFATRALHSFRSLGEKGAEASALFTLGCIYAVLGDIQQELDHFLMSLSIYRELGQMEGVASCLTRVGDCYFSVGEIEIAEEFHRQASDLLHSIEAPWWLLADNLVVSGHSLSCQGDLPAAIAKLEEALGMYREFGNLNGEANCLVPLANCYASEGRLQEALESAELIVVIGQEIGSPSVEIAGLMCLSNVHMQLGQVVEGIGFLEQGLQIAQNVGALGVQIELYRQLGGQYQNLRRLEEAQTYLELAIRGMEQTFSGLEMEAFQEGFFLRVRELYVEYFMLLLEMGETDETLWVAERSRARTYVEQVGRADVGLLDLLPETGIRSGVISAEQVEQDARAAIANLPASTAAIEYFVTDGQTFVWVMRDGTIYGPRQIELPKAEMQRQVIVFRTSIEAAGQGMSSRPDAELLATARDLYQILVAPVTDWLEGIDHIVIVPSGPLYYLPFGALFDCPACEGMEFLGGEYLIEQYSISYTPSLSTLRFIQQRDLDVQGEPKLLALADPASGNSNMPRLPEAQQEAEAIATAFDESTILVDTAATEDALRRDAANADHLLLSTHGLFDSDNPMYSYLMLTPTVTSDGRLHTYEVFELVLQTDLVTLSACETLLPALETARETERAVRGIEDDVAVILSNERLDELTTGDDVVGLTRAFLYAGSSSVLSSLWRVVSETTEQLMVAFYGYMENGMDKAGALRQAQLDIMTVYPHPRYWAAFNLVGDWEARFHPLPESMSKLSSQLFEQFEEWRTTESSESELLIVVLVILHEAISEELVQRISSLSENIEVQGGFGRFLQLEVPISVLSALSRLAEVEQITEQPTMSTTP